MHYNPRSGVFTRLQTTGNNSKKGDTMTHGRTQIGGKTYSLHHLAVIYMTGRIPTEVKHLDGNKRNNTYGNLKPSFRKK